MCKLFTGSMGTLGVITEVTARLAPLPETAASIIASGLFEPVMQFVHQLSQSQLLPAAIVLMNFQESNSWQVSVWCEGLAEHVTRHLRDGAAMAQRLELTTEILRDRAYRELWDKICDFPLAAERCVYRATLPRTAVSMFFEALRGLSESPPKVIVDLAIGTVWLSWPANSHFVEIFPQVIALAAKDGGHAVIFAAPLRLKEGYDVWGPPAATYSLMRKIKHQFDPNGLLNPGRFLGGI
jgi:glycolate oxidase FAD binding subunit